MITLELKAQGESIKFFGEADSSAAQVENEVTLAPGAVGPPAHRHPGQTETFNVVSGKMVAKLGKEEKVINAGEVLVVTPGQSHTFYNNKKKRKSNMANKLKAFGKHIGEEIDW